MTKLLISIRSAEEAELVSGYQVGIVDVKEPNRGALGASDPETLVEIAKELDSAIPKSFSAGELRDWTSGNLNFGNLNSAKALDCECPLSKRYGAEVLKKYDYVKVGLAGANSFDWRECWSALLGGSIGKADGGFAHLNAVGVVYLDFETCDAPSYEELLDFFTKAKSCKAILFDTHDKTGDLFTYCSLDVIESMILRCRAAGLSTVIAGSVSLESLPQVLTASPDFVGVRGAVCAQGRDGSLDNRLLQNFIKQMRQPAWEPEGIAGVSIEQE